MADAGSSFQIYLGAVSEMMHLNMNVSRLNRADPIISVLMPVYNTARYARTAVESVLSQTFVDFELLALDDGSTDKSLSILREFAAKDHRVQILSRRNRGLVLTRNELIAAARGHYLAVMDSDDISRPQRFEKQVAYLDAHSDCVAVGSRSLIIDSAGLPIIESKNELTHNELDLAHVSEKFESRMCHSSVMMRREAVMHAGSYRGEYRFSEDLDLFLRLAEMGKLANLPEVLVEYRQHLRSVSFTDHDEQRYNAKQAVRAAWARRGIRGSLEKSELATKLETPADTHRKWAWWALSAGNLTTARKHATLALAKNPLNIENLRVLVCSIRGH